MIWLVAAVIGIFFASDHAGFFNVLLLIVAEWAFTNGPIKRIFERQRPDNSEILPLQPAWLKAPRSSSFPSGHSSAAALSTVLWFGWDPVAGIICLIVALAMALSRVVLRAHHKTDVAAGLAWGAALAGLALLFARNAFPS